MNIKVNPPVVLYSISSTPDALPTVTVTIKYHPSHVDSIVFTTSDLASVRLIITSLLDASYINEQFHTVLDELFTAQCAWLIANEE